jgi:hypothetical protein
MPPKDQTGDDEEQVIYTNAHTNTLTHRCAEEPEKG